MIIAQFCSRKLYILRQNFIDFCRVLRYIYNCPFIKQVNYAGPKKSLFSIRLQKVRPMGHGLIKWFRFRFRFLIFVHLPTPVNSDEEIECKTGKKKGEEMEEEKIL